jgi:hypothetical protein
MNANNECAKNESIADGLGCFQESFLRIPQNTQDPVLSNRGNFYRWQILDVQIREADEQGLAVRARLISPK